MPQPGFPMPQVDALTIVGTDVGRTLLGRGTPTVRPIGRGIGAHLSPVAHRSSDGQFPSPVPGLSPAQTVCRVTASQLE